MVDARPAGLTAAGPRSKAALIRRLRRVEGQVQGLQKMVATERDREEILVLIAQVRGALHGVAALVLQTQLVEGAKASLLADDPVDRDRIVANILRLLKSWAT